MYTDKVDVTFHTFHISNSDILAVHSTHPLDTLADLAKKHETFNSTTLDAFSVLFTFIKTLEDST